MKTSARSTAGTRSALPKSACPGVRMPSAMVSTRLTCWAMPNSRPEPAEMVMSGQLPSGRSEASAVRACSSTRRSEAATWGSSRFASAAVQ